MTPRLASAVLALFLAACPGDGPSDVDIGGTGDTALSDLAPSDLEPADGTTDALPLDLAPDAPAPDQAADLDGDGIADALEATLAKKYFPYYSLAPKDKCPRHGVLYRLTKHPGDAAKIMIWYVVLYEKDCGALGHVGDAEVFGALVDPTKPPPAGLLALRAISHYGTLCQKKTTCGSLPGCSACTTAKRGSQMWPVVFSSVNKHGGYVSEKTCDLNFLCDLGGCTLNSTPSAPPMVNAGEPGKPLVTDLTTQGFITPKNGWTETALKNFNPWSSKKFGTAGVVKDDLTDKAFVVSPSGC